MPIQADHHFDDSVLKGQDPNSLLESVFSMIDTLQDRLDTVLDRLDDAVVFVDGWGCIEGMNPTAEQIFDVTAESAVGKRLSHFVLDPPSIGQDVDKLDVTALRADGQSFPAQLSSCPVRSGHSFVCMKTVLDNPPRRNGQIYIIRDLTHRIQVEQELRNSESRFRDLAGSASDWFWETDTSYCLTFVSERIASVLGVKPAAILGHSFFDIGLGDGNSELAEQHSIQIQQRQSFRDVVFHVGPPEGKDSRIIRISGLPIYTADGDFVGYRGVGVDITREIAAENRARNAQQQLVEAVESLVDAFCVYDSHDQLLICNEPYSEAFGTVELPITPGVAFQDVLEAALRAGRFNLNGCPESEWLAHRVDCHRLASGEPFEIRLQDGRWLLNREYRTRDGNTVGVRTDITDLKQREAELDSLRHRYELILGAAGEGIIGLNGHGIVTFANPMAATILQRPIHQMVGQNFHAMTSKESAVAVEDTPLYQAYRHGLAAQVRDHLFDRPDGSSLHVEYQITPMVEAGQVSGAVLTFRDATLRLLYEQSLDNQQRELERLVQERTAELQEEVEIRTRTEQALRSSRVRLKAIADSLFEGVLVIDRHGQMAFANSSARRQLGMDDENGDLEGHHIDDLLQLRRQGRPVRFHDSPWQDVLNGAEVLRDDDADFEVRNKGVLAVAYACSPLTEENGRRSLIISFRDIAKLKDAQREALQSSRLASVGQLAAGIAHEINTPVQYLGDNLRFIGSSLDKLSTVLGTAGQPEAFGLAADSVKLPYLLRELPIAIEESLDGVAQIGRIVLSMKEFSHPGTSSKTVTDLNRAIESTLTVSHNNWKHVANIDRQMDPHLPSVLCYVGEMNQVFLNLIINAAHAIEESGKPLPGTITIRTARIDDMVEISVADTGTGIPDAIRDRIFDPFFTTKDVGRGTGQGLAICQDVVRVKHGGQIEVAGQPGVGAIFTLRLPINGTETDQAGGS